MVPTKTGPKLVLEHTVIYQLISDRLFWEHNPVFLPIKDLGELTHTNAVNGILGKPTSKPCIGCGTLRTVMRNFSLQFAEILRESTAEDREQFVQYITKKRGYRPTTVVMYYSDLTGRSGVISL